MIGSFVVGLSAKTPIRLKGLGGEALHGLIFNIFRKITPDLTSRLHSEEQKPFSLSPFLEGHELRGGYSYIAAGRTATFKLSIFTEDLLAAAIEAFFTTMAEGRILSLSNKPVTIETINMCPAEEASFTTFHKLLDNAQPHTTITLQFLTPTTFKGGEIQTLFPEPRLVFSSLLKRWNAFSDIKIPEEYMELLALIKVSNYNLCTELVNFSKYKIIGFKGKTEYRLPEKLPEPFYKAINALADFAFYTGVGAKTTMGMGQTRRANAELIVGEEK